MDGFIKEDFGGPIRKGMTMEQIDMMVSRQLRMMQEDYERCQKYEDPSFKGDDIELKGKFEQKELEDGTQFKDDKEVEEKEIKNKEGSDNTYDTQQKGEEQKEQNEENAPQKVKDHDNQNESENEDGEDDNRCVEDYYQPLDNDANENDDDEEDEQWTDFQNVEDFKELPPERDPRKKEIDYEKIRQLMSTFTLQAPSWATDKNVWEQKVEGLINDIQK